MKKKKLAKMKLKPMRGLSFDTKSNVPVLQCIECQNIIYLLCTPTSLTLQYPYKKKFCTTSRWYGDDA